MTLETGIGAFGALIVLSAFIAAQTHKMKDTDRLYDGLNVLGSGLLIYYAISLSSWPFFIVNAVWFLVSARDLMSSNTRKRKV